MSGMQTLEGLRYSTAPERLGHIKQHTQFAKAEPRGHRQGLDLPSTVVKRQIDPTLQDKNH